MEKAFVHSSAFLDDGAVLGEASKVWHYSHIMPQVEIGHHCTLGQNVFVANNVKIGNFCKIQNNVSLYEGVELEDYVFCGPSMVFTNIKNPRCKYPQNQSTDYVKTLIKEGASIGANATIVCGITIHENALIAAGAVVTKDVPAHALIGGVPGKILGWVCQKGHRLDFSKGDETEGADGFRYKLLSPEQVVVLK